MPLAGLSDPFLKIQIKHDYEDVIILQINFDFKLNCSQSSV